MHNRVILVILALTLGLALPAEAADPGRAIRNAGFHYGAGRYDESIFALREAMEGVWEEAPLMAFNVTLVKEQPQAYGMYNPRGSNVFESIDPMIVYFEPVGQTAKKSRGWYRFSLAADFDVANEQGEIIGGQRNFYSSQTKSRAFNTEFMMFFTVNLKGLKPGKYTAVFTLYDRNSSKKTAFEQPFVIR